MIALSLKDIRKSFGADEVLKGVTLHLTDDMRLGLQGATVQAKQRCCASSAARPRQMQAVFRCLLRLVI